MVITMKRYLLTTVDNPYHPGEDFAKWLQYDHLRGYYTDQRLAKVAKTSIYLTDAENQRIVNDAVDDFIRLDELGLYKRVVMDE